MYFAFLDKLNKMKKYIEEIRMIANIGIAFNFAESDTDAKDIIINQANKFLLFITFQ
jgi:proline dehydrogenase